MIIIISISLSPSRSFSLSSVALRGSPHACISSACSRLSSSVSLFYCQVAQHLYWCFYTRYISIRTSWLCSWCGLYVECVLQHFASLLSFVRAHLGLLRETDLFPLRSPARPTPVHFSPIVLRVGPANRKSAARELRYAAINGGFVGSKYSV